jgi:O-antigen/teichoic acid export membrane protein
VGFLASSAFAAVLALVLVYRELGAPDFAGAGMPRIREGFYFSVGQSAGGIYSEIDKTMLARLATLQAAGAYGAAYRILDVAVAPLLSLLIASYTQFFRSGTAGVSGTVRFAKRLLPIATGYGAVVGVGLWLCAPLIPYLLGEGYADTVGALRWLALLPVLRAVQFLGADTLTGAGKQAARSALYVIVAVVNVGLNFWLIPLYSWRGAAWASLVSDGLLALLVWCVVLWLYRAERGAAAQAGPVFVAPAEAR